jgi:HK97 family phage portal protein
MTTIQTADGRLLTARRPSNESLSGNGFFPVSFPPMWSDGERFPNALTDSLTGVLASYDAIYRNQPVLAGVVDMMAYRAATLPLGAFTANVDGSRDAIARSDGLATLLRRPRPRASTVHLLNHIYTSLFVHGNALVAKLRSHGDPESPPDMLWPLDWQHITAYGEVGGEVEVWGTFQFGREELFTDAANTIHFAFPGPDGGPIGISPLEKLGVTIRLEDAAQRYQTANFRNGNRPSNVVSFQADLPREKLQRNLEAIAAMHKGVDQAGKTLATSGDTKVYPLSMTAVEASLIDQRRLDREEIAIMYGISGPNIAESSNNSQGNVIERFRAFYRDVLPPYATLVVETFEAQLCDPEPAWMDRLIRHDFGDKLRGEPLEQANVLKILTEAGIVTRNEARLEVGRGPDGNPSDPDNPADQLTLNANNQASIDAINEPNTPPTPQIAPPTSRE